MLSSPMSPNRASAARVGLSPELQYLSIASPEESQNNVRTSEDSSSDRARENPKTSRGMSSVTSGATVVGDSPRVDDQECQEQQPRINESDETFRLVNPENNLVSTHMGMVWSAFRPRIWRSDTPLNPPLCQDRCLRPRQDPPKRAKHHYIDVTAGAVSLPRFPSFDGISDDEDETGSSIHLEMKPVHPNFDIFSDTPLTPLWDQDGHQHSTPPAQMQLPSVPPSAVLTESTASPCTPNAAILTNTQTPWSNSDQHSNTLVTRDHNLH